MSDKAAGAPMDALVSASENPVCREGATGSEPDEGRENDGQVFHCLAAAGTEPTDRGGIYHGASACGGRRVRQQDGKGSCGVLAAEGLVKKGGGLERRREHREGAGESLKRRKQQEGGLSDGQQFYHKAGTRGVCPPAGRGKQAAESPDHDVRGVGEAGQFPDRFGGAHGDQHGKYA